MAEVKLCVSPVTPNTVQDAIMISNLWQMMDVKNACMDYMERQIDVQNCLGEEIKLWRGEVQGEGGLYKSVWV